MNIYDANETALIEMSRMQRKALSMSNTYPEPCYSLSEALALYAETEGDYIEASKQYRAAAKEYANNGNGRKALELNQRATDLNEIVWARGM